MDSNPSETTNEIQPLVNPNWWASPWLLLDVRYQSKCPVCGQIYNSQVQTYAADPLPKSCNTSKSAFTSQSPGWGACRGTVPASAL